MSDRENNVYPQCDDPWESYDCFTNATKVSMYLWFIVSFKHLIKIKIEIELYKNEMED